MIKLKKIAKKRIFVFASVAAIAIIIGGFIYFRNPEPSFEFATAEKRDIKQEVGATGRVKPAEDVELAFEKSGKAARVNVKVGDKVFAGQILVSLENNDLFAELRQAEAEAKTQKAKLGELKRGFRPEEIQIQKSKAEKERIAAEEARKNLVDKIQDAFVKSDDAARTKTTGIFSGYKTTAYSFTYVTCVPGAEAKAKEFRLQTETDLDEWEKALGNIDGIDMLALSRDARVFMDRILALITNISATLSTGCTATDKSLDAYRSNISAAAANITAAISNLSSAEENLRAAESNLTIAEQELALKESGTAAEQISAQEAQVESAEAKIDNLKAQIAKTILVSPISGIVVEQNAEVGEIIQANAAAVSVISVSKFEIEADIAETDIAKIKIGDPAEITLDAYGSSVIFHAETVKIEPAAKIIEGVATYKTTFQFVKGDDRVKSGMTANISVLTAERKGVVVVPHRAISVMDGNETARLLTDGKIKEAVVKTGLRGSDGNVEIIEGIKEGDKVVISVREE